MIQAPGGNGLGSTISNLLVTLPRTLPKSEAKLEKHSKSQGQCVSSTF
jgi:hypothetical protein